MKLVDSRTYKVIKTLEHEEYSSGSTSNKAALSPSGKYAVAGGRNGQLFVWNAQTGSFEDILEKKHLSPVVSC